MNTNCFELNFDGLVGPTHHYAGLSFGNLASTHHGGQTSNPKAAALQGLAKMKWVADLGIPQGILPPQSRPNLAFLRELGFQGTAARMIDAAWKTDPRLVTACYSASSMWTANAATISPSADCQDNQLHITPANLISGLHRSLETVETSRILHAIFADDSCFQIHSPLPASPYFADEGAANHTRFCLNPLEPGVEFFVYGHDEDAPRATSKFPARQTRAASEAVARRHRLDPQNVVFCQQNSHAIDAGVFHNDVIAVGHRNFLLHHEHAFRESDQVIAQLQQSFERVTGQSLHVEEIPDHQISLATAVQSYLFNSQFVTTPEDRLLMLCPAESEQNPEVAACLASLAKANNPIDEVHFFDLRQSMNNGGGPACLRLRVVMRPKELAAIHQGVLLTDVRYHQLESWVERRYRDELRADDLRDPKLATETQEALDELSQILRWPSGFLNP